MKNNLKLILFYAVSYIKWLAIKLFLVNNAWHGNHLVLIEYKCVLYTFVFIFFFQLFFYLFWTCETKSIHILVVYVCMINLYICTRMHVLYINKIKKNNRSIIKYNLLFNNSFHKNLCTFSNKISLFYPFLILFLYFFVLF